MNAQNKNSGYIAGLVVTLIAAGLAIGLLLNRQQILDQIAIWQAPPSSAIQLLAGQSGLNETGKFNLYAAKAQLQDAVTFNQNCSKTELSTAILGCYVGRQIYIYNVTDDRIKDVRAVTAAHEMLHAAYDRLGKDERSKVDRLVDVEYERIKSDPELTERMAFYDRTEPGERHNELHSIIGTEINGISSELESYYAKYFADRSKVVALHANYSALFSQLQNKADTLKKELDTLGAVINQDSQQYNAAVSQLNDDVAQFNARAQQQNGFNSQAEFTASRSQLIARTTQLDALRTAINAKVTTYNQLRSELSALAIQSDQLNHSINSSLAPVPTVQ